jgi:hypothetical protein
MILIVWFGKFGACALATLTDTLVSARATIRLAA